MRIWLSSVLCVLMAANAGMAGEVNRRDLRAQRVTGPIVVDGRLTEPAWATAPIATGFVQSEPDTGAEATEATVVRVLYDDTTLYVGVFAAHRDARDIVANELRRDFDGSSSDWFAMIVDPFHDRRNGYQFGVNPAGAAWDSQKFNEGRERNLNWDGIWSVRTSRSSEGWYAEFAIPFKTLQIPSAPEQTWGINFQRHLQGRLENSSWAPLPRLAFIDRLSLAGTLSGLAGVSAGTSLRIKPFISARRDAAGEVSDYGGKAGLDVKYAVTSGLSADVTINTDFSQVEADVQQVGATRFSVLFPEKREFFLENSGIFQFGPAADRATQISAAPGASAGGRDNSVQHELALFFSRRIGLTDAGRPAPIHAGGRLTGTTGRSTFGALVIRQGPQDAEPGATFTVLRGRRNFFAGADAGLVLVTRESDVRASRVLGFDVNVRPLRDLGVSAFVARSLGTAAAAEGTPLASRASVVWRDGRWSAEASVGQIGAAFEDSVGFVPRLGIEKRQALVGRRFSPRGVARWLREVYPAVGYTGVRREGGAFDAEYWEHRLLLTFENGAVAEVGANPNEEDLTQPFAVDRAGRLSVAPGRYAFTDRFVRVSTSRSRPYVVEARYSSGGYYGGERDLTQVTVGGRANVHLSGDVGVSQDAVTLPAGRLRTRQLTARLNYGFSTRAFFNGLVQYHSATRQWSTNLRFNLIHHPLSDLFVVYSDERAGAGGAPHGRSLVLKVTHLVAF